MTDVRRTREHPTPAMPEVMTAVASAVHSRGLEPRRRRSRRWFRGLIVPVAVVAVTGSALAAAGQWHPFGAGNPDAPTVVRGPAIDDQTATLGVLRRPQTPADRSPLVAATVGKVGREMAAGVRLDAVRHLGRFAPASFPVSLGGTPEVAQDLVLIPVDRFKGPPGSGIADQRDVLCLWMTFDSWPAGRRQPIVRVVGKPPSATLTPRPAALADRISTGGTCRSAHEVRTKGFAFGGNLSTGVVGQLVPDGVATIRATAYDGRVVSARVHDNVVLIRAPLTDNGRFGRGRRFRQGTLEWLAADGRVLRRL